MKKLIISSLLFLFSISVRAQFVEPIRMAMDVAGDIEVAIALQKKYAKEMKRKAQRDADIERERLKKQAKRLQDKAEFMKNYQAVIAILRSVDALMCMIDDYEVMLSRNNQYGYTCYQDIRVRLYVQEMSSVILRLSSLFNLTKQHVESIDKNIAVLKETEKTAQIADRLNKDIKKEKDKEEMIKLLQNSKDEQVKSFAFSYYNDLRGVKK